MSVGSKIKFLQNPSSDPFTVTLRERVEEYFRKQKLSKNSNATMLLKSFLYLTAYGLSYSLLFFQHLHFLPMLSLWVLLGFLTAGIGFNIGHDAIHGAYSSRPWINRIMGYSFLLLGGSVYTWKILHNLVHHTYTNIPQADGDIHPVGLLRFHKSATRRFFHRFQHWYAPFLYGFTSLVWVFKKDYDQMFRKQELIYKIPDPAKIEYIKLFLFKGIYYFAFLIAPLLFMNLPWWQILLGFLAMHFVAGFCLAIVFQLGHMVTGPEFPEIVDRHELEGSWFEHQIKTASNFSTNSFVAEWLFGGLNFQIEHHLFPKICHIHYRNLSPIVRKTAADFGLPYYDRESFYSAVRSHLSVLRELGRKIPSSIELEKTSKRA